jgi:hypothetical protein
MTSWLRMAGVSPYIRTFIFHHLITSGIQIYKIDNKSQQVSEIPKTAHGMFNGGDTYFVLNVRVG